MNTTPPSHSPVRRRLKKAWPVFALLGVRASVMAALALSGACAVEPPAQGLGGAATPAPAKSRAVTGDAVNASRQAVAQAIALSCSQQTDCATIGIGARACGGPEQYLAYSLRQTAAPALQQANDRYARLRRQQLEARGEMSTCEVLPDPGALCSAAGQCQLQAPPGGPRGASQGQMAR